MMMIRGMGFTVCCVDGGEERFLWRRVGVMVVVVWVWGVGHLVASGDRRWRSCWGNCSRKSISCQDIGRHHLISCCQKAVFLFRCSALF